MKKVKQLKGFVVAEATEKELSNGTTTYRFHVFTTDEWSMGAGYRYPEWECDSLEEAEGWCKNV